MTVAEWAKEWLEGQAHLKPSSWERYAGILREHVLPEWGEHRIADVGHAEIQRWVTSLTLDSSPSTMHKIHRTLSLVLKLAVKDGRLVRNPADGVNLPRIVATEHVYLTHDQVDEFAQRCGPHRLTVLFLAYTGVLFGEMVGLLGPPAGSAAEKATTEKSATLVRGQQVRGASRGHERRAMVNAVARSRVRSTIHVGRVRSGDRPAGSCVPSNDGWPVLLSRYPYQQPPPGWARAAPLGRVHVNAVGDPTPALWSSDTPGLATTAP